METIIFVLAILALTTLCISDLAVLGLVFYFVLGHRTKADEPQTAQVRVKEEDEENKKARDKFIKEQRAFQEMLNYNAYTAYGMKEQKEE